MPNRIIRESALTSHSLAKLSDGAERLFWRLTIVADDYGRFDAYPSTVKAKCFPTKVDCIKTETVRKWLLELSRDHCIFYTVGERVYGYFCNWLEYQRSYGVKSKFPEPAADCGELRQTAADCGNLREIPALIRDPISENRESRIDIRESISVDRGSTDWTDFEEVWTRYPKKVGKEAARKAWKKLNGSRAQVEVLLLAIEKQKLSEQWQDVKYIPHLSTWLNGQRWTDEPTQERRVPKSMLEIL